MKAILVHENGGPDVLSYTDVDTPAPEAGELLVRVEAAGLNFIDTYHREGLYPLELPFTPGLEGAGTVTDVGEGVDGFTPGDRVGWTQVIGSYREFHRVPQSAAVEVPESVDTRTMAALLLQGVTAHYLANDTFPLGPSDTCVVHAGAGGVGLLLTQIAKQKGATVITTVGTAAKAEASMNAGADHVIVYTQADFKTEAEAIVGERAVDVVYDGVGEATFNDSLDLLRPRGMMVTFGNASGPVEPISPLLLARKGSIFLTRPTMADYLLSREELLARTSDLLGMVKSGRLNVEIGAEYPLVEAPAAHRALQGRETIGKVLLIP